MGKHTPEPWEIDAMPDQITCQQRGDWIMLHGDDWLRAKACVNACAGIPTEQLEAGCVEELVREAKRLLAEFERFMPFDGPSERFAWDRICAALAPFQKESGQ